MPDPQAATGPADGWKWVDEPMNSSEQSKELPSTNTALTIAAAGKSVGPFGKALTAFSQSANAPKVGSAIARNAVTLGTIAKGVATGDPAEVIAAPRIGWAAGKGGYFLTKGAQSAAAPIANAITKVAPYAQTLSTLSGAQGVLDLAQMAEPNRKDIGILGIGTAMPDLEVLTKAVEKGANPAAAAAAISRGDMNRFGALMTAYMQSRQAVK